MVSYAAYYGVVGRLFTTACLVIICNTCGNGSEVHDISVNTQALASGTGMGTTWWKVGGANQGDRLGSSVEGIGDINGDGYDDLAVGAPLFRLSDDPYDDSGRVYIFLGGPDGVSLPPSQTLDGEMFERRSNPTKAGDVNGDGYADVLIDGDLNDYNGPGVRLHLGRASGLNPIAAWHIPLNPLGPEALAAAGDVNGDGRGDVLISVRENIGATNEYRTEVYAGTATGLSSSPIWSLVTDEPLKTVTDASGVGDFNGDGYADVILGDYWCDDTYGGKLVGFWGSASGLSTSPDWIGSSGPDCAHIGREVELAGDINGDGYADVLTSSASKTSFDFVNRVQAYFGGPYPSTGPAWYLFATDNNSGWVNLSGLGDTNGDGLNDIVLGLDYYFNPHNGAQFEEYPPIGRVRIYQGRRSGSPIEAWYAYDETLNHNSFGEEVAAAGDLNGDGWADIVTGDPFAEISEATERQGIIYVYYGTGGSDSDTSIRDLHIYETGSSYVVASGSRLASSEGFDVGCVGMGTMGRTRVALEAEVKPVGSNFDAQNLVRGEYSDTGLSGTSLRLPFAGLNSDTSYQVRVRLVYDPATPTLVRHSRWRSDLTVTTNCDLTDPDFDSDGTCDSIDSDDDDDGYDDAEDCDSLDSSINPGATEIVGDDIDQDCSGADRVTCHVDADGDGYGASDTTTAEGNCRGVGVTDDDTDCDDGDATRYPEAPEVPSDAIDQDCDGTDTMRCYVDQDGDGWGGVEQILPIGSCPASGLSDRSGDCDDAISSVYPGGIEVADDGIDQDCSGADTVTCYSDEDGDGFGGTLAGERESSCGDNESRVFGDCDDASASVYPGAVEIRNDAVDQDCSGGDLINCYLDADGDGFGIAAMGEAEGTCPSGQAADAGDCDDTASDVHPGGEEIPADGIDQDCSGTDSIWCLPDQDNDGYGADEPVAMQPVCEPTFTGIGGDCDNSTPQIHPSAEDDPGDGIDQDCNGVDSIICYIDADGDGHGSSLEVTDPDGLCDESGRSAVSDDCDDTRNDIHPGAEELPGDGIDKDCDGEISGTDATVSSAQPDASTSTEDVQAPETQPTAAPNPPDAAIELPIATDPTPFAAETPNTASASSGCGCRVARRKGPASIVWWFFWTLLALCRTRRRFFR